MENGFTVLIKYLGISLLLRFLAHEMPDKKI